MAEKLSVAELAKTLVQTHYHGVISTVATDGGYPYGSVIDYLPLSQGDVVVLLHEKAEHYRYLRANPKASLLINAHLSEHEAMHVPRVTLLGQAQVLDPTADLKEAYLQRHPDAAEYSDFDGLHWFQLDVVGARYIAGIGRAVWLEAAAYRAAAADPLGEDAHWLMHQLNDHRQSGLVTIAHHLLGQTWVSHCCVVSVDRLGFDLLCYGPQRRHASRLVFDQESPNKDAFDEQFRRLVARAMLQQER